MDFFAYMESSLNDSDNGHQWMMSLMAILMTVIF